MRDPFLVLIRRFCLTAALGCGLAGCSAHVTFSRPDEAPEAFRLQPIPISLSPELASLMVRDRWGGIDVSLEVGSLLRRVFTPATPSCGSLSVVSSRIVTGSSDVAVFGTRWDSHYVLTVAAELPNGRSVLHAEGSGGSGRQPPASEREAVEVAVVDLWRQVSALCQ